MNEGDENYCALYIDGEKSFESWTDDVVEPDKLLQSLFSKLNGKPMEYLSIEYTNRPFYDDDENVIPHEWPDRLPLLNEED